MLIFSFWNLKFVALAAVHVLVTAQNLTLQCHVCRCSRKQWGQQHLKSLLAGSRLHEYRTGCSRQRRLTLKVSIYICGHDLREHTIALDRDRRKGRCSLEVRWDQGVGDRTRGHDTGTSSHRKRCNSADSFHGDGFVN